jgi:hypothetical protein
MKPIITEGDYVLSLFDATDNEIEQVHVKESMIRAIELGKEAMRVLPHVHSYRVMRCIKNSKYNIHSPGQKT